MPREVIIDGKKIGPSHKPYLIAEISGNHLRDLERARMIFSEAKNAGADAVKIQTYTPESLAVEISPERLDENPQWREAWGWGTGDIFNLYKQTYTPPGDFTDALFALGKEFSLTVFSTPFSVEDAKLLAERYQPPAYKIGALEVDFFPMLEVLAATKKPLLLNTAIATLPKIEATLDFLSRAKSGPIILMTGPKVYHEDAAKNFGLGRLQALRERFGGDYVLGLSDHFRGGEYGGNAYGGEEFSATAIGKYEVSLVEKHFCGKKSGLPARALKPDGSVDWSGSDVDGAASIETADFARLRLHCDIAHKSRLGLCLSEEEKTAWQRCQSLALYGIGEKFIGPSRAEIESNEAIATRFIYAKADIAKNETLCLSKLHFSRAIHSAHPLWKQKTAIPTSASEQLLFCKALRDFKKGEPIFAEDLSPSPNLSARYEGGKLPL